LRKSLGGWKHWSVWSMSSQLEWGCSNNQCWAKTKCERWWRRDTAKKVYPFNMDGVVCLKMKEIESYEFERLDAERKTDRREDG